MQRGISRVASTTYALSVIWIALSLTRSPLLAGLSEGLLSLPLIFSFAVGAFVDSYQNRKLLMVLSSLARVFAPVTLLVSFGFDWPEGIAILISLCSLIIGFTSDIVNSVTAVWTKTLLSDSVYKKGVSVSQLMMNVSQAVGIVLTGVFLTLGSHLTIYLIQALFFLSLLPLFLINPNYEERSQNRKSLLPIVEGFRFIGSSKPLVQLIILGFIANFGGSMIDVLISVDIKQRLGLPAYYLSLVIFAVLVGGIIGSIIGSRLRIRLGTILTSSLILSGTMLGLIGMLSSPLHMVPLLLLIGLLLGISNVGINTSVLKIVQRDYVARFLGAFNTFAQAITFASGPIAGLLIQISGVEFTFFLVGFIVFLSGTSVLLMKELREISF